MRYLEIFEGRAWETYRGRKHRCLLASPADLGNGKCVVIEADVYFGSVVTGRTETFHGYYVEIACPLSEERWRGEDRRRLLNALELASDAAKQSGWDVVAIGRTPEFKETGLSENSGYGTHPAYPDRHVHMLEPLPRERDKN